jgi:SAM-dependent methyltransferase
VTTLTPLSLESIEHTMRQLAEARDPDQLTVLTSAVGAELEAFRRERFANWTEIVPVIRATSGFARLQEDPFTSHGYLRPRGYPGDAELLDFIYRRRVHSGRRVTAAGLAIFRAMTMAAAPRAVRHRQAIVARQVDAAALALGCPVRVGSLGCGHLAEAERMASLETGAIEAFWAIDQDPHTLAEVRRRFPQPAVVTAKASVREFLRGIPGHMPALDVFYAAGLFDYLHDRAARCLVRRMFDRLGPGGTLLIANFVPGIPDRAYMEAIMDWWLVYRTPSELAALAAALDTDRIADSRTVVEPEGNIAFLVLRRK